MGPRNEAFDEWWAARHEPVSPVAMGLIWAAWNAATERAAGLVDAARTCECEGRVVDGGLDWCECYGYQTLRRLAANIRDGGAA